MQRDEIRLECMKLAAGRTPDHSDALKRAEDFFDFVMKPEEAPIIEQAAPKAKSSNHVRSTKSQGTA